MDDRTYKDFLEKVENPAQPTEYLKEMFRSYGQKGHNMIHEGERIDREIKRLERELEQPIADKRRIEIKQAINHLKDKKSSWQRPRS